MTADAVMSRRALPLLAALVLCGSGILAVIFPRALFIGHPSSGTRLFFLPAYRTEFVSATGCRNYGVLAILAGAFLAWGATGGSPVPLSDRGIAKSIVRTKLQLELSYGRMDACTVGQIEGAVRAAQVSPRHLPYLCAAFMGRDEFDQLRASMPDVDWSRIEERVARIASELPYKELRGDHFHESWVPSQGSSLPGGDSP
jgi:hypothetical protein